MKSALTLGLMYASLLAPSAFAAKEFHGGDLVRCQASTENSFNGDYALDYVATYKYGNDNADLVPVTSWSQSSGRILKLLQEKLPFVGAQFADFLRYVNNTNDYAQARIWEEARFGLEYLKDQNLKEMLPPNCREYDRNGDIILHQLIDRESAPGQVVYHFDPQLLAKISASPLQHSFALLHEFLYDLTTDMGNLRRLNRLFHSQYLETATPSELMAILHRFLPQPQIPATVNPSLNEALWSALKGKNVGRIAALLAQGADVNAPNDDPVNERFPWSEHKESPLIYTVRSGATGALEMTDILIRYGADPSADFNGLNALYWTMVGGNEEIFNYLQRLGLSYEPKSERAKLALGLAVRSGQMNMIARALEAGADPNIGFSFVDNLGFFTQFYNHSLLNWALEWGYRENPEEAYKVAKLLWAHHADPNLYAIDGYSALTFACSENLAACQFVLSHADVDVNLRMQVSAAPLQTMLPGDIIYTRLQRGAPSTEHRARQQKMFILLKNAGARSELNCDGHPCWPISETEKQ